jgi:hypothetical protein
MTRWANNQTPTLDPAHELKRAQCKSKGKLKRMLVKEWLCNLIEILS